MFTTLSPTTVASAAGVPLARGLNLRARPSSAGHDHHGDGPSARTDFTIPKFAGSHSLSSGGLVSRTRVNRKSCRACYDPRAASPTLHPFFKRVLVGRPIVSRRHSLRSPPALLFPLRLLPPKPSPRPRLGINSRRSLQTGQPNCALSSPRYDPPAHSTITYSHPPTQHSP